MAESHEPLTGKGSIPKYDWATWFARPFKAWVLSPETDFDIDPVVMQKQITSKAWHAGISVVVSRKDPVGLGRIWLCAYELGSPKPKAWRTGDYTVTAQNTAAADTYVCSLCGKLRPVIPWFAVYDDDLGSMRQIVQECINETGVGNYIAEHRADMPLPVVDASGFPVQWVWNKETGPTAKEFLH